MVYRLPTLITARGNAPQSLRLRDNDDKSSRSGNCCRDFAPDFGTELCRAPVTPPVGYTFRGKPWCRNPFVRFGAGPGVRLSQGHFGLSVWSGNQLPISGSPVWRPRPLVALVERDKLPFELDKPARTSMQHRLVSFVGRGKPTHSIQVRAPAAALVRERRSVLGPCVSDREISDLFVCRV